MKLIARGSSSANGSNRSQSNSGIRSVIGGMPPLLLVVTIRHIIPCWFRVCPFGKYNAAFCAFKMAELIAGPELGAAAEVFAVEGVVVNVAEAALCKPRCSGVF